MSYSNSGADCVFQGIQHAATTLVYLNLSKTRLAATEDTAKSHYNISLINKTLTHLDLSIDNEKFPTQVLTVSFKFFSIIPH